VENVSRDLCDLCGLMILNPSCFRVSIKQKLDLRPRRCLVSITAVAITVLHQNEAIICAIQEQENLHF
jgi:hypothetical protein